MARAWSGITNNSVQPVGQSTLTLNRLPRVGRITRANKDLFTIILLGQVQRMATASQ